MAPGPYFQMPAMVAELCRLAEMVNSFLSAETEPLFSILNFCQWATVIGGGHHDGAVGNAAPCGLPLALYHTTSVSALAA